MPPYRLTGSEQLLAGPRAAVRRDRVRWPDGLEGEFTVFEGPQAAVMVPVDDRMYTVLVRQWRHAWATTSWEAPAGTLEPGEDAWEGARRELAEEAGLEAAEWLPLGTARATAMGTIAFHLFLARRLRRVERSPEQYERDMVVRELPLVEAIAEALNGGIEHAASIAALVRAGARVGLGAG